MKDLTLALHCVANWMDRFQGDLFIDFPKLYERWKAEDFVYLAVAKTHSNIIGVGEYSLANLQKTLGVDFVIGFHKDDIVLQNIKLSDKDFEYILDDLRKFNLFPVVIE